MCLGEGFRVRVKVRECDGVWAMKYINFKNLWRVFERYGGLVVVL